jgi:CarD family transcriptional regulator
VFEINEYIVYGNDGVCKVEGIGKPDFAGVVNDKKYYMLKPVFCDNSTIYTPIDNSTVIMRRVMTSEEVRELIDSIPEISTIDESNHRALEGKYKEAINTMDCREWVKIIKTVYEKKQNEPISGKRIGQIDKKYMKQAEDLLYSELSIPLNIPKENVEQYITDLLVG